MQLNVGAGFRPFMKWTIAGLGSKVFSFAIILLAIVGAAGTFIKKNPWTEDFFGYLFVIALIIVCILPAVASLMKNVPKLRIRAWQESKRYGDFVCKPLLEADLSSALEMFHAHFIDKVTAEVYLKAYQKCQAGWRKIVSQRTGEMLGYFIVIPLSMHGEISIKDQGFDFGDIDCVKYIPSSFSKRRAMYIAMICTKRQASNALRAFTIQKLTDFKNRTEHTKLYARATTPFGLKLIKSHEFTRVDGVEKFENHKIYFKNAIQQA